MLYRWIGCERASGRYPKRMLKKRVLYQIIMDLQWEYNILQVLGHRDTSPDLNGDGVIEPYEYVKACPCFDVKEFLRSGRELLFLCLFGGFWLCLYCCRDVGVRKR